MKKPTFYYNYAKKKTAEAPADKEESKLKSPRDHTLFIITTSKKSPQISTDNCEEEVTIEDQGKLDQLRLV